jgi:hypothetical protein
MAMKSNLEKHASAILPPNIFRGLVNLRARLLFATYGNKKTIQANHAFKNCSSGKRAFLLATGPSIKLEDLKFLEGEDCFSLSNFFLHEDLDIIRPKFHFFTPYHEPLILDNYIDWLKEADCRLPVSTNIVLGHKTEEIVSKHRLFADRKVYYLFLEGMFSGNFDITKAIMSPQTGPIMILPWLLYMGYSQIFLIGCDHSILRDYGKTTANFYPKEKEVRTNATSGNNWPDVVTTLGYVSRMFEHYEYYRQTAEKSGKQIINLSQDSWLDIFKKDKLADVLKKKMDSRVLASSDLEDGVNTQRGLALDGERGKQ